jgi:hypothetical protein
LLLHDLPCNFQAGNIVVISIIIIITMPYNNLLISSHLISSSCYWYLQWQKLLHNFSSWSSTPLQVWSSSA